LSVTIILIARLLHLIFCFILTLLEISNLRLLNQKIGTTAFTQVADLVSWMGAIQAQDYAMAKWAIGLRMLHATDEKVESAINSGEIIRTHVLRPTWHLVSANDIYWMLQLTAPGIKTSMNSRNKQLELSEAIFTKSNLILEKELSNKVNLTREEIAIVFKNEKIKTEENRLSHLLLNAELEGLICSGRKSGNKITYGLLPDRVPDRKTMTKDESLAELAKRYFTSHGPATIQDFTWWSGLSVADARKALDFAASEFICETIGNQKYWFPFTASGRYENENSAHLLPAFDEFLISYRDRSAALSLVHTKKAVSDNGIFRPIIVINGQITGLWKRTIKNDNVKIETDFFQPITKTNKILIEKEAEAFGRFLNKKPVVNFTIPAENSNPI
jgi:hypothetical protein